MTRWPHQVRAVADTLDAIRRGYRRICLTSPTGMGKSVIACDLIRGWLDDGLKVSLYTNRKLLVAQLSDTLNVAGFDFGIRAADHYPELHHALQISSIQTENSRVLKSKKWAIHPAERVVIDEGHLMRGDSMQKLVGQHVDMGATIVYLTATPIAMGDVTDLLIPAGTNSEGRACGALVPCLHYGPDEPDLKLIGKVNVGEDLTEGQNRKAIMTPTILGRVLHWYRKLNPEGRPTILFAPGVGESLWFAEQFKKEGIKAAHIDGEEVWIDGRTYRSDQNVRDEVLDGSRAGGIQVLCNRFVLREGIDAPWLAHGIFATVFGSLQSYLQSGGRLLRSHPSLDSVTLQDHGGNWHRHGSLNADRTWDMNWSATMVSGVREERLKNKQENEPVRCPKCGLILASLRCPCGFVIDPARKSRPVIQADGTIKQHYGDIFKKLITQMKEDTLKLWTRSYFAAKNGGKSFRAAIGWFYQRHGYFPPETLPLMPRDPMDLFLPVKDVPQERLVKRS